ncbi:uncharacterized, partial [Tachysurus ichikawai]
VDQVTAAGKDAIADKVPQVSPVWLGLTSSPRFLSSLRERTYLSCLGSAKRLQANNGSTLAPCSRGSFRVAVMGLLSNATARHGR